MSYRPKGYQVFSRRYWRIVGGEWGRSIRREVPKSQRVSVRGRNIGHPQHWRGRQPFETVWEFDNATEQVRPRTVGLVRSWRATR